MYLKILYLALPYYAEPIRRFISSTIYFMGSGIFKNRSFFSSQCFSFSRSSRHISLEAVRKQTLTPGSLFFNRLYSSKPSIFFIITSSMTRPYVFGLNLLSASTGSLNVTIVKPTCSRAILRIVVISGSSSTHRMFLFLFLDDVNLDVLSIYLDCILYHDFDNRLFSFSCCFMSIILHIL